MEPDAANEELVDPPVPGRFALIRDALMFQLKLALDGARDVVLVPISLSVAVICLILPFSQGRLAFYDLLAFLRRTDKWINLFGAADRVRGKARDGEEPVDVDKVAARVEGFVVGAYKSRRGGGPKDEGPQPR